MARVGFNLQVYSFFSSLYKRCIGKPITLKWDIIYIYIIDYKIFTSKIYYKVKQ